MTGLDLGLEDHWPGPWPRGPMAWVSDLKISGLGLGLEEHWPGPWPQGPLALALALKPMALALVMALISKTTGLGLGLVHAVLEPIPGCD